MQLYDYFFVILTLKYFQTDSVMVVNICIGYQVNVLNAHQIRRKQEIQNTSYCWFTIYVYVSTFIFIFPLPLAHVFVSFSFLIHIFS